MDSLKDCTILFSWRECEHDHLCPRHPGILRVQHLLDREKLRSRFHRQLRVKCHSERSCQQICRVKRVHVTCICDCSRHNPNCITLNTASCNTFRKPYVIFVDLRFPTFPSTDFATDIFSLDGAGCSSLVCAHSNLVVYAIFVACFDECKSNEYSECVFSFSDAFLTLDKPRIESTDALACW